MNTKQTDILKSAHDLFWRFGIRRITVEEICRQAATPESAEVAINVGRGASPREPV